MVFHPRKLVEYECCAKHCAQNSSEPVDCSGRCQRECLCCPPPSTAPPAPVCNQALPAPPPSPSHEHAGMPANLIALLCVMGGVSLLGICLLFLVNYYSKWQNSRRLRRSNSEFSGGTREDFLDENHGPVVDHPIWLITTIGLPQSVIDSITVFKYKRDEKLIEGTECSVCLNEFQEDESLRLLPKCSHAFHVPCIDTWLRSHKNCPLCRAPIFSDVVGGQVTLVEPNSSVSGLLEETQMENLENYSGLGSHRQLGEDGASEVRVAAENLGALATEDGRTDEISRKDSAYFSARSDFRVLSDLADHSRAMEEGMQPVRRSVSMDASSASMIYYAVANIRPVVEHGGSLDTQSGQMKSSEMEIVAKRGGGNSSTYKLMKSSSLCRSLQKGPISMKRSFSSSGKLFSSRHHKSLSSILPL